MPLLVCAATSFELSAALPLGFDQPGGSPFAFGNGCASVTGVGIPETMIRLTQDIVSSEASRILNIGIAGAYPGSGLSIGDVVVAKSEVFGDVGMELPSEDTFLPISATPFGGIFYRSPLEMEPWLFDSLPACAGCTVNSCTGTLRTGQFREKVFGAQFETMEGAAVAQVGASNVIQVTEVRAISNIAADRDMRPENIRLAIDALRIALERVPIWN